MDPYRMTPEIFAEWLKRRGRFIVRTSSSYWHSEGTRALQAFPYHWLIDPSERELRDVLSESRAICLRYSARTSAPLGLLSYHVIREGAEYVLNSLGKWARKNVRRGLRNCSVERITFERLAEEGWALQADTLERQNRRLPMSKEQWRVLCLGAKDLPGFEAWGALVEGHLAASVITFLLEDCAYLLYQQCDRQFLAAHVNNALSFTVTQTMIGRPGVRSVFYSLHSLDASPTVDEFKFRMGYSARMVRQRVVFHPFLQPFVNPALHSVLRTARTLRPGNPVLTKAEGMVRFYLEGKRPLDEQEKCAIFHDSEEVAEAEEAV